MSKTIGILGAGQLAQLLTDAAKSLDLNTLCYSETDDAPAAHNSELMLGTLDDLEQLTAFAKRVDVITLENENIEREAFETLSALKPVYPSLKSLLTAQDRLAEKTLFQQLQIPTNAIAKVDDLESLQVAAETVGLPAVLKTRRLGYDGKGQAQIESMEQLAEAWKSIGEQLAILEEMVPFDFEVSQIAARDQQGKIVFYPLIENRHKGGILRQSSFPYENDNLAQQAQEIVGALLEEFGYVGTLACEFFVKKDQLLVNEIAPRVHNSGHLTIEATSCSQFSNHIRAVAGLPVEQPELTHSAALFNIIGEWSDMSDWEDDQHATIYDYHKAPRSGRKLGHVTVVSG